MRIDDNLFPKFVDRVKEKDYPLYKFLRERILGLEAEPPSEGLGDVINFNPAEALQTTGGVFNPGELIYRKDLSSSPTNKATVEGYVVKGGVQYYKIKENKEFLFSEKILAWYIFPVDEAPKSPDFPRPPEIFGSINPLEEKPFKEPSREGERAEEPTREEEEAEPVKEVYNSERLRELSQGGESPDVANARLGTARQEFVSLYKEYLAAKKSTAKVDSLKNKLFFWKKGGKKAVATSEEVMDAKVKMEVAREAYLLAKQEYGRAVFQEKVRELVEAGLSPDEVAWELNNFNGRLFNSLMLKEEAELNKSKAVDWPAKERGFLRKGFDWYIKQHWTVRVLVTTGLFTGAIFGGSAALGVAMGSTIGAYAATRLLRSGTAAGLGQMFGKVIDAVMSHSIENYVKTNLWHATVDLVESGGNPKEVFDEMWAKQNKIFEARKKKEKIKLLSKVGVMIATGLG
ncbi:MAG: hypothetical protein NTU97_03965, partial [Candidatus Magasanikbacteria bacterium]|nr:hypothetical protein [Candidatus Magasanikbacteria bacterium]